MMNGSMHVGFRQLKVIEDMGQSKGTRYCGACFDLYSVLFQTFFFPVRHLFAKLQNHFVDLQFSSSTYISAQNKSFSLVWVYLSLLGCPSSEACEIITFLFLKFDVSSFLILFSYMLAGWRGLHVYEHNIMQILAVVNFFVYVAGT